MDPLHGLERTVGKDVMNQIQQAKLLVVGSGGIGCELLKDLALSGFRHVEVIDLDTIDVSNLNRQLLFRSHHVGLAKCKVACEVAEGMVPPVRNSSKDAPSLSPLTYHARHGNVCDQSTFNIEFVKQFNLVLNALDNVEARRRVNRLCMAAGTPLVEAGTTGYLGQVTVIHKPSEIACYECKTQETQKVYPICTIRSTPSMPVHTIVWGKELYKLLFHSKAEQSMLYEDAAAGESTYMQSVETVRSYFHTSNRSEDEMKKVAIGLLDALYSTEIRKQLDMDRYAGAKTPPTPLDGSVIRQGIDDTSPSSSTTNVWTLQECVAQIYNCFTRAMSNPGTALEEFDKDDDMSMRFVAATSNLRSQVFGITPLQSLYSAKGIAGNIIPAIATTNAICAGVQILQAIAILKAQGKNEKKEDLSLKEDCYYVNCIRNMTRNGLLLTASKLDPPNPKCFICGNVTVPLRIDVHAWTLERFIKKVLKEKLGFQHPTIILQGDFVWEEGEGADLEEFKGNLPKVLSKLPSGGVANGSIVEVDDATQDLTLQLSVTHEDMQRDDEADEYPFEVGDAPPPRKAEDPKPESSTQTSVPADDAAVTSAPQQEAKASTNEVVAIDIDDDDEEDASANKRKQMPPAEGGDGPPKKKAKVQEPEIVEIE